MKLLFVASALVRADANDVERLIDNGWVLRQFFSGAAQPADEVPRYVDVDHGPGTVGFQGHRWYRGEISVTDDPTTLHYRVYNIARRGAWAVPLANRLFIGYAAAVQSRVDGLAAAVEQHVSGDTAGRG